MNLNEKQGGLFMDRTVFQPNRVIPIVIFAVVIIGSVIGYIQMNLPIWIIPIALLVGGFVVFSMYKTKLVIEDGFLRYEKLGGGDEVELSKVSHIVMREVETIVNKESPHERDEFMNRTDVNLRTIRISDNIRPVDQERKVEKIIYVLDADGRTIFSMPANVVRITERRRFAEAINAVNPNIQVF